MMDEPKAKTIQDLADMLGISKSTVSRALNGNPVIAEETRRRVAEAAKTLKFSKNIAAQRLTSRASRTIAFVTHENSEGCTPGDWFGLEILGGLSMGLQRLGYETLVKPIDYRDYSWVRRLLDSRQVDGFVLMTSSRKDSHIQALVKENAPFIAWGGASADSLYPSVCADGEQGGRLVGEYFVQKNWQAAVIAGPRDEAEVQQRLRGFVGAFDAAGRPLSPDQVHFGSEYSEDSGRAVMTSLLAAGAPPRAVFAHSDLMALGVVRAVKAAGLRVPDDVAVVGFDDLLVASHVDPPLTTVSQRLSRAGQLLARGLVGFLETGVATHVVLPVELILRGSA